jgi:glutamine amidotransferase
MSKVVHILRSRSSNWRSVGSALSLSGHDPKLIDIEQLKVLHPKSILILPGVGNIKLLHAEFSKKIRIQEFRELLKDRKVKVLGICLGFQFLTLESEENPGVECLGLLDFKVEALHRPPQPVVGWKKVEVACGCVDANKLSSVISNSYFYFTHSFGVTTLPPPLCSRKLFRYTTNDGLRQLSVVAGIIAQDIIGFQFHPEKSGGHGVRVLSEAVNYLKESSL